MEIVLHIQANPVKIHHLLNIDKKLALVFPLQEHLSLKKYIVDIVTDSSVSTETKKDGEERQKARKKAKKLRARMNSR